MSKHSTSGAQRLIGIGVAAFGALLAVRWLAQWHWLTELVPGSSELGLTTPLSMIVAGVCCALLARPLRAGSRADLAAAAGAWLLMIFPALTLLQSICGINLHLDLQRVPTAPTLSTPMPGLMSPNTALAFIAAGVAFWHARRARARRTMTLAIAVAALLSGVALIGSLLGLEAFYRVSDYNRMLLPTAAGLFVLSFGLWLMRDRLTMPDGRALERHSQRITRRAIGVLMLAAATAGIAGFAVMRETFEKSIADNLNLSASTNAESLVSSLETAELYARSIASRPAVAATLESLNRPMPSLAVLTAARELAASITSARIDSVSLLDAEGKRIIEAGVMAGDNALTIDALAIDGLKADLRWSGGYMLRTQQPLRNKHGLVGSIVIEQRLPLFDKILSDLRLSSASSDALLCSKRGDFASCAPTRFHAHPFMMPLLDGDGSFDIPVRKALDGEDGVQVLPDDEGVTVMAAYTPLRDMGLGLIVQTNLTTLYEPLQQRALLLAVLLLAAVALGTWALRLGVQPLVYQVVNEQQRIRRILDQSNDAFIALTVDGRVTDWNRQAELTFGYREAEVIGRPLVDLIASPAQHAALAQAVLQRADVGAGPLVQRRLELHAQRRDGCTIPIELSVTAVETPAGYVSTIFARDIGERKAAERRLADSEQRLRSIADNMPALIAQIDAEGRYLYVNAYYHDALGLDPQSLIGRRISEARDANYVQQLESHVNTALSGFAVAFESTMKHLGQQRHFQHNYMPNRDGDGQPQGFYALTLDVTERKRAAQQLADQEKRLRMITDNLPVLIAYIDKQEHLRFVNRTLHEWTGIEPEAAQGRHLGDVMGPAEYGAQREYLARAMVGERVQFDTELRLAGKTRHLHTTYIPDLRADGSIDGIYALSHDVTATKRVEQQLKALARIDPLTGLPNRRGFNEKLDDAIARARRNDTPLALLFLDVDHFKQINDGRGHACGDAVLQEFARRLAASVRVTDTAARLAGDEFVVLLDGLATRAEAATVADKVVRAMRDEFTVEGGALKVSTSVGVAFAESHDLDAARLSEDADTALYAAKAAGRNTFRLHGTPAPAADAQAAAADATVSAG